MAPTIGHTPLALLVQSPLVQVQPCGKIARDGKPRSGGRLGSEGLKMFFGCYRSICHMFIYHNIIWYLCILYIFYRLYCSMLQINHMIQKRSREYSRESLNVRPNSSEVYNWWDNLTQLSSCRSPAAQHLGFDSYGDLVPSEFMVSTPLIRGTSDDPGLFNKSLQCFMFNKKNTLFA